MRVFWRFERVFGTWFGMAMISTLVEVEFSVGVSGVQHRRAWKAWA
jgi:hypothetical protein